MSQFIEQFPTVFQALNIGFLQTVKLFLVTLVGALPLGLIISFGSMSKFKPLSSLVKTIVWIFRGSPLMIQMLIIYYMPGLVFHNPIWGGGEDGRFTAAAVAFILNYACRQTGFAMLAETNPQEVMDLGAVAHLAAIEGRVPFINFFDGFRTSHEIQKIEVWDYDDLKEMCDLDAVAAFRERALNPEHPVMRGSHENDDIFFQHREACNKYYDAAPAIVEKYMDKVNAKLGTNYKLFNYYGAEDAENVIVAMGSICDVAEEVIDYLTAKGEKVGLIKVRLYRPFSVEKFVEAIPATCKKIAVLDRTKEPGSIGEPLFLDVVAALNAAGKDGIKVIGGRYGLGSKDTPPSSVFAVYDELKKDAPKAHFTIGITDDVTYLSLE